MELLFILILLVICVSSVALFSINEQLVRIRKIFEKKYGIYTEYKEQTGEEEGGAGSNREEHKGGKETPDKKQE